MPGIVFFYLRLIARAKRTASDPEALAGWCLLHKKSFRTARTSFGPARVTKRLIAAIAARPKGEGWHRFSEGEAGTGVWDNRDVATIRYDQIRFNGGRLPSVFIARNEVAPSAISKSALVPIYLLLWPFLCVWSLFSRNPQNIALLYDEWNEAIGLMQIVKKFQLRYMYFYCPYELDANAIYLLMKKRGIYVNKIPSPNLLSIHNQEILTDALTLTSPCQSDELPGFRNTAMYSEIIKWLPEQFASYADVYRNARTKPAPFSIGFYSHGSWMRKKQGVKSVDVGDISAELELITVFGNILRRNPQLNCTVFLHPKEKKAEHFEATQDYYDEAFGKGNYVFAETGKPGVTLFDTVDIGVGALSTILFERLFLGCKTIFYPKGIAVFPIPGSAVERICPVSENELETLILQSSKQTLPDFLRQHGLEKYTIFDWKPELHYAEQN